MDDNQKLAKKPIPPVIRTICIILTLGPIAVHILLFIIIILREPCVPCYLYVWCLEVLSILPLGIYIGYLYVEELSNPFKPLLNVLGALLCVFLIYDGYSNITNPERWDDALDHSIIVFIGKGVGDDTEQKCVNGIVVNERNEEYYLATCGDMFIKENSALKNLSFLFKCPGE